MPSVLLVDDDQLILRVQSDMLGRAGFATTCHSRPIEALAALEREQPDVIIADYVMPEVNGIAFLDDCAVTHSLTDTTASSVLTFTNGKHYIFNDLTLNGAATGTRITLKSDSVGNAWFLNATGTPSVHYVSVSDSDASSGNEIDASDGLASLADTEGTMSLEAYLKSRRGKSKQTD